MTMDPVLESTRKALFEVFRESLPEEDEEARRLLERHVVLGKDDPGQWSTKAVCIIHAESIPLPGIHEDFHCLNRWQAASDRIPNHFIEHINNAVAAVYPC